MARRIKQMAQTENTGQTPTDDDEGPVPFMQKLLDNHFLLLFLGVVRCPLSFYHPVGR